MSNLKEIFVVHLIFSMCWLSHGASSSVEPPVVDAMETGVYMREWLVCGPFPNDSPRMGTISLEAYASDGFYRDHLAPVGGEPKADPRPGDRFTHSELEKEYRWEYLESEDDLISFENHFETNDHVVAYAFTQHRVARTHKSESFSRWAAMTASGSFLNGELVHSHLILRWLGKGPRIMCRSI